MHSVVVFETWGTFLLRFGKHCLLVGSGDKIRIPRRLKSDPYRKPLVDLVKKAVPIPFITSFRLWKLWEQGWNVDNTYEALKMIGNRIVKLLGK